MRIVPVQRDFDDWRAKARLMLSADVAPGEVTFVDVDSPELTFDALTLDNETWRDALPQVVKRPSISQEFIDLARSAGCYRDPQRWDLLYRVAWRLTHDEPHLLHVAVDPDVQRLAHYHRGVRRDVHKMHAFVRFRRVVESEAEAFVAWHRPDHFIVHRAATFFAKRFPEMRWAILTPDDSVAWDPTERQLHFGPGATRDMAPQGDELEELWKTYYAHIFNPARLKIRAMKKEMPVRHWRTMPEAELIPELIAGAPARVKAMIDSARRNKIGVAGDGPLPQVLAGGAAPFVPARRELNVLREASKSCQGCDLYCHATQTVFGQGPETAALMLVGEQPGDNEDLEGRPFIGPAGQLLDDVLRTVGIPREQVYVTNAVKHFKFEPRGTRRLHAKPDAREMNACRPWLEAEIETIKPKMIVCLGATAAQTLMGPAFRVTRSRGIEITGQPWAPWMMATIHPSAILRIPDPTMREAARQEFVDDLQKVATVLKSSR